MKILLLQPPIQDFYDTDVRLQPIGLAYLKSSLLRYVEGVDVKILDLHRGHGRRTVKIPRELSYLKDYYKYDDHSPFCGFNNFFHYGANWEKIEKLIAVEKPDVVGISSLFSPYYREVVSVASLAKRASEAICKKITVVVGGSHANALPESLLESSDIDYVICGEGEKSFCDLILQLKNGNSPKTRLIPAGENFKIDEIPFPDLSDFSLDNYLYEGRPMTFMITSRSCPHKCSFCSVHNTFGTSYRRRRVENVLEEIRLRYRQGFRVIDFEDDNLTFYKKEMTELCEKLVSEFPNREMEFVAMNGISYLSLDRDLLQLMKRAGFSRLNLSLVSSDKTVLESTKRPHTIEKYLEVVNTAFELGFKVTSYQILGLPFETLDSMIQTMVFAAKLPVLLGASPFYLTPGSPIARQLGNLNSIESVVRSRLTAMANETKFINRDQLYTLFLTTRIINFIKGLTFSSDRRESRGLYILNHLFSKRELLADTSQGFKTIERFDVELFFRVFEKLEFITKTDGQPFLSSALRESFPARDGQEHGLHAQL